MLRLALASYLTLALLAGPAFCCCAAARFAERIVTAMLPSKEGGKSPTCPHCCKSPQSTDSDQERPTPTDCPNHCPCQQDRADAVQLHDSGVESVRMLEAKFQTAVDPLIVGFHVNDAAEHAGDTGNCISRNALTLHGAPIARLLSALQLLLC